MRLSFQTNLDEFNEAMEAYVRHSRFTAAQVVAMKGADLGFRLMKKLRELAPEKGKIRDERTKILAAGGGLRVRPRAREWASKKSMITGTNIRTRKEGLWFERGRTGKVKTGALSWWQLAVKRELNMRESGRGYLGFSSRFKNLASQLRANRFDADNQILVQDRYRRFVSAVGFKASRDEPSLTFKWGDNNEASIGLAKALQKPRARSKIGEALSEARADMMVYLERKMAEKAAR